MYQNVSNPRRVNEEVPDTYQTKSIGAFIDGGVTRNEKPRYLRNVAGSDD